MAAVREPARGQASGGILEITLDRPPANAIDAATSRALYEAFARLEGDPDLRVGIVTAAGDLEGPLISGMNRPGGWAAAGQPSAAASAMAGRAR